MKYILLSGFVILTGCGLPMQQASQAVHPTADHGAQATAPHSHLDIIGHGDADDALQVLIEGNARFVRQASQHPRQDGRRRLALASGQQPRATIITCSDSRVPPEIVFDQGLGDLFVIRAVGEVADTAGLASIEYAVEHLGSPLVVVMGHVSCGAVSAALTTPVGTTAGSPSLDAVVDSMRSNLKGMSEQHAGPELVSAVEAQVHGSVGDIVKRSAILRHALKAGRVKIVEAVYHLDTGVVRFLE